MIQVSELQSLFSQFINNNSQIQGVILTNSEGLVLISALSSNLEEEKTAAISSGVIDWVEKLLKDINKGELDRIIIEGGKGYCVLVNCQHNVFLLVIASKVLVKERLFLEIKSLVKQIQSSLSS